MNQSIKNMDFILGTFILGFLSMGFQLVASRLLAPYFGSSIIVWAFLISTFLAAFSCGSFLGGWISKKTRLIKRVIVRIILVIAIFSFAVTAFLGRYFLSIIDIHIQNISIGLLISCLLLFFVPIMMVSSVIPIITDILAKRGMSAGVASGLVYGISTIGNISGVMGTTFILIPNFKISCILEAWVFISLVCLVYMGHKIDKEET
jgi:MFS family permease